MNGRARTTVAASLQAEVGRRTALQTICNATLVGLVPPLPRGDERPAEAQLGDALDIRSFGAKLDGVTDDTIAVTAALAAGDVIFVPRGICIVQNLSIPDGKTLFGTGNGSVLRLPARSRGRPILVTGKRSVHVRDLTIDGGGTATSLALFTSCEQVTLHRLWVTGSAAHGVELDNCDRCELRDLTIFETGTQSSHAAIYLKDPTGRGSLNRVSNVSFDRLTGRGLHVLGNDGTQIADLRGRMSNGEILLIESSADCVAVNIAWRGPGVPTTSRSDGIAFNGDCFRNVLSGFFGELSSGHAVSINGQAGRSGASYNTVENGKIVAPNEGGVIITDQGVTGSMPRGNVVLNVVVENAGMERPNPAFSAWGSTENRFENCTAQDTQRRPTTTYGFEDGGAVNASARNSFSGRLIGPFVKGKYILGHASSSVREAADGRS